MNKLLFALCMPGLLLGVSACNGILGDIYDDPPPGNASSHGFVHYDATTRRGRIFLNMAGYRSWTYLDFTRRSTTTLSIPDQLTGEWDGRSGWSYYQVTLPSTFEHHRTHPTDSMPTPDKWDIALHHYDVRTNGGEVFETSYTSLEQLLHEGNREQLLAHPFTPDEWTRHHCYYDLSGIYEYHIGYQQSWCNLVLSRWMNMDVTQPPPTYTLSRRVYLVRLTDDSVAALHFPNHISPTGSKGYVTIDYIYPY